MPLAYVEPEVIVEHKGVSVYHTYKNGYMDARMTFWYKLDIEENGEQFDIRELPNYSSGLTHNAIIKQAIEVGYLK